MNLIAAVAWVMAVAYAGDCLYRRRVDSWGLYFLLGALAVLGFDLLAGALPA